jgi:hypothetical protein
MNARPAAATQRLEIRATSVQAALSAARAAPGNASGDITSMVIFAQQPPSAVTPASTAQPTGSVRLLGIAIAPGRRAALVSINGQAPRWAVAGETIDDFEVLAVDARGAKVRVAGGEQRLTLFKPIGVASAQPASSTAPAAGPTSAAPMADPEIPPGVRLPPPPADAPAATKPPSGGASVVGGSGAR